MIVSKFSSYAIDVQLAATADEMEICLAAPQEFITIEQTSGYPLFRAKNKRAKISVN
jgi:hypothetical protein